MNFASSGVDVPTRFEMMLMSELGIHIDLSESTTFAMGVLVVGGVLAARAIMPHLTYR